MSEIKFGGSQENRHQCKAEKEGDWIVFRCPHCSDYERRIHGSTGKMTIKSNPNNTFLHTGSYMPMNSLDGLGLN